jgi:DNA-binding XRE family transcriptional regulator
MQALSPINTLTNQTNQSGDIRIVSNEELLQETLESIGLQLKIERSFKKLSQKEAADIAGLHRRTISDLENGKNGNIKTMIQYALALDVSFALLIARAEHEMEMRRNGIVIK